MKLPINLHISSLTKWILLFSVILISASNYEAGSDLLLDVESLVVRKNAPARFVFELEEDEEIYLRYSIRGKADDEDIFFDLYDLSDQKLVKSFSRSNQSFRASNSGSYEIEISSDKNAQIDFTIQTDIDRFIEPGVTTEVMRLNGIYVEEKERGSITRSKSVSAGKYSKEGSITKGLGGNVMKVNLKNLEVGDYITVSSNDPNAGVIKVVLSQTSDEAWLAGSTAYSIGDDGNYTLEFYVEQSDKNKSLFNLFKSEFFYFGNLEISLKRNRKTETGESLSFEEQEEIDPMVALMEAQAKQREFQAKMLNASAEEKARLQKEANEQMQKAQAQMLKSGETSAAFMLDVMKQITKTKTSYDPQVDDDLVEMTLDAKSNISGKNRSCELISVWDPGMAMWFYWIGVDPKVDSILREFQISKGSIVTELEDDFDSAFKSDSAKIYDVEGIRRILRSNFPDPRIYDGFFTEQAQFAIVNSANSALFLEGKPYEDYYQGVASRKSVGFDVRAIPREDLFFCSCNKNEFTPVTVEFHYFLLNTGEYQHY